MRREAGMTLIELLVAVFVFAVMMTLTYSVLDQVFKNSDIINSGMNRVQEIQTAMRFLESDVMQTAPRPVRDELGEQYANALQSNASSQYALELTRSGWTNPAGLPRSTLQRVGYALVDGELSRFHWYVLDRTFSNEPVQTVLLSDVDSILVRYLQANGEWTEQWPPIGSAGGVNPRNRPRAVEIRLTLPDQGELSRIVELAP